MAPTKQKEGPLLSRWKEYGELLYWRIRKLREGQLVNHHYIKYFTEAFRISSDFYKNKSILDIGCGPRGSLEWANMAEKRIGLDPLAEDYLKLNGSKHHMEYVKGYAEAIPFDDNSFDVVSSFNNLDHVEDLSKSANEMCRVLKPGGLLLLIVDIHPKPQITEPQVIEWALLQTHFSSLEILEEDHLGVYKKHKIYSNVMARIPYDPAKNKRGIIIAKLRKAT